MKKDIKKEDIVTITVGNELFEPYYDEEGIHIPMSYTLESTLCIRYQLIPAETIKGFVKKYCNE